MIQVADDLPPVGTPDEAEAAFWRALEPEPVMTVSEWAADRRWLSRSTSGQPGPWRNETTPYLVEIMDSLSASSTVETVVFLAGSQVGKTEVGNNWLGYIVDVAPGPALFVLPTTDVAQNVSKERLKPLFEETPALQGKVKDARDKSSGSTLMRKEFEGGMIKLVSSESPGQLRSTPARYLFGDEVDAYPQSSGDEGDPCELAARAQITFRRAKQFWTSTPTIEGSSKIEKLFRRTDQRVYLVPCPDCGHEQRLQFTSLDFDSDAKGREFDRSVKYACQGCGSLIDESQKNDMVAAGRWEPTAESEDGKSRGYHLNALYSPFISWAKVARKFLLAKSSPLSLQTWTNLYMGETWQDRAEVPNWNRLYERRESYRVGTVPRGGVFLTAGIDVQGDRFEFEVVAWGPGRESWSVEYRIVQGKPEDQETQLELFRLLDRTFPHDAGVHLPIRVEAWDSGDQTALVYQLVAKRPRGIAVKGRDTQPFMIAPPTYMGAKTSGSKSRRRSGTPVHMVGTNVAKEELYTFLRLDSPTDGASAPPGFCHFPATYSEEFFKGLTAEELRRRRDRRGRTIREWHKVRERNEPLDCRVYARAGASQVGIDRWDDARWADEKRQAGLADEVLAPKDRASDRGRRRRNPSKWDRFRR